MTRCLVLELPSIEKLKIWENPTEFLLFYLSFEGFVARSKEYLCAG